MTDRNSSLNRFIQWAITACLIACSSAIFAQLRAELSSNQVAEFQPVRLTISLLGDTSAGEPDLSVLAEDFVVGSTSTSRSYELIGSRFSSRQSWSVELTPKRTGTIQVPPIQVGGFQTDPLTLSVNPLSDSETGEIANAVYFESDVSHETQYPQAAVYVTRKLLYNSQVRLPPQPDEKGLTIENATVIPLGSMEQFQERRNGVLYTGMSWRYVVFAEKSGTITIPAESVRAGIYLSRGRTIVRSIVSEEKNIEILPIPPEYPPDKTWLPASHLDLSESYNETSDGVLDRGEPLTRTVTLRAQDSYHSTLPNFEFEEVEGLRIYPEQAKQESLLESGQIWGVQEQLVNYIALDTAEINIPVFSVTWWDINSNQVRSATLPMKSLAVEGMRRDSESDQAEVGPTFMGDELGNSAINTSDSFYTSLMFYLFLILASVGWGTALYLYLFKVRLPKVSSALTTDQHTPSLQAIRKSLRSGDVVRVKKLILDHIAGKLDLSFSAARDLIRANPTLDNLVNQLDAKVYSDKEQNFEFKIEELIQEIQKVTTLSPKQRDEAELASLLS